MFNAILKHLNWIISENQNENKFVARKKFEENLRALQESDNEDDYDEKDIKKSIEPVAELAYSCSMFEGVITSLDQEGGIINGKHNFSKTKALDVWNVLKAGSKVSFFLYKDTVESMKLLDAGWEENYEENLKSAKEVLKAGFNTESRTVLGIIDEISDGIITVDVGNSKHYVPVEEQDFYMKGDNVRLSCVTTEDEENWNPSIGTFGNIVSIKSFEPNSRKQEVGRVTAIFDGYAVFDESVILINNQHVKLWERYFYEAIETSFIHDGRNFNWRVVKLIEKLEGKDKDAKIEGLMKLEMNDEHFQLRQSHQNVTKYIMIFNRSNQSLIMKGCEMTSNCGFMELQSPDKTFELRPFMGNFKIFLNIKPKQYGTFVEELTVDFGIFKKRGLITLQVLKSNGSMKQQGKFGSRRYNSDYDGEIIPGLKINTKSTRFIEIRIPDYFICDKFRKSIDFKKQMMLIIQEFGLTDYRFLLEPLKEQNYLAKMRYCLYLEEIAMEIYFERYKIDRAHFENKDEYLRLAIEGVNEKRPSIGMGDSIHVKDPYASKEKQQVYEGIIHKVENDSVLVKFHSDFHSHHNRRDYTIEFFFSRASFKRQQFALDQMISPRGLGLDFLFPKIETFKKNLQLDVKLSEDGKISLNGSNHEFYNKSLNVYQKEAVVNVLRGECRPLPYIIYGPPGTGKTRTVIECIEQISSKIPWSRIIVATPSNSAANLIVEQLVESGRYKGGDFVRFVSYNQIERDSVPQHLKKYCATIDIGHDKGDAANFHIKDGGMMMNCSKSIIIKYKIYISTLSTIGLLMHIKFLRDHFTHVIIDEAGQAVETDSLIPCTFLSRNKGQVILAGDPKQLGPVLVSPVAKYCGFDKSLLERLSEHKNYLPLYGPNENEFDNRFVTKLKKNYRSLPSILNIYSQLFYNNELESEVSEEDSHEMKLLKSIDDILWNRNIADKKCAVFFINVNGRNLRTPDSSSWFNDEEASRAFIFACRLQKHGIAMKDIGIITPYSLQVKRLRGIIDEAMPNSSLKVGSVEEFQGQERDIILVSTVRTNHKLVATDQKFGLGFLQCAKRMNVAVSRARALLVVFGKESLLAQDENWRYLIQYTRQMGTYVCDK